MALLGHDTSVMGPFPKGVLQLETLRGQEVLGRPYKSFRAQHTTATPHMNGPQTALVVGPEGETVCRYEMRSVPMTWAVRLLRAALGLVAVGAGIRALAIAGVLASTPCKEERGGRDCPTVPQVGAAKPEILPTQVRPYHFSESGLPSLDTDPRNAETIVCVCAICESRWLDRTFVRPGADVTQASPTIVPTQCRLTRTIHGFLIGSLAGKEIVTVENPDQGTALRWLDIDQEKVRKEQKAARNDDFLGGGNIFSDEGDGVIAGGSVVFTNTVGALRRYPSRAELPVKLLSGNYSPRLGRSSLHIGAVRYVGETSADGVVYERSVSTIGPEEKMRPINVNRIWASHRWILRSFAPSSAIWMVSQADGSDDQFLAYGGLGACGQPLMGDYALNLEASTGYSVMALSLLPDVADYRIRGIPLDKLYCVAGDGGIIAVTGRFEKHPAVAVYHDGTWERVLLPDSPSVLEPVVQDGTILVSAPEEAFSGKAGGSPTPSVGVVYVLGKDASTWRIRERIGPANPRRHGNFGYKVVLHGKRLFINYLDNYPKSKGMLREGFGYPSVCETTLP